MKKILKYLCVFLIPIFILDLVLILKYGIDGFGNLFIVEDMHSQYSSLMRWFQDVLQGDASLFYSFSKGIGGNMFSSFAYYLSSPLNILLLFFDKSNYIDAIALLIHLKIGLSSIMMFIFLKYKFKNINFITLLMFACIYALSGAMVNFYSNIMWIDILYLTPLVIMFLDKLIHNEKSYLYIIFLSISIISNFYIAFMLCIFCVIYYIYETVLTYSKNDKEVIIDNTKKFILYSLLSVLISSIILIPLVMDMTNMFRYGLNKPIFYFDIKAIPMILSKLFIGTMDVSVMFSHFEANVYTSLFALLLVIYFFLNKKIKKKEKIVTGVIFLVFILSILFNGLNLLWHGLSFPNGYNYRFIFFYSFFFIIIACKSLLNMPDKIDFKLKLKSVYKYVLLIFMILLLTFLLRGKYTYLSDIKIIITLIFLAIYFIWIHLKNKINIIFLLILILVELGVNINYSFITKKNVNEWYLSTYGVVTLSDVKYYSKKLCSFMINDNKNYRIDTRQLVSYNDGLICDYSTINTALSTNHASYYEFLNNAGYSVTYSTIIDDFSNGPFIDSILGLKSIYRTEKKYQPYYVFKGEHKISDGVEKVPDYTEYENPFALNLGYIVASNNKVGFNKNAFEYQNDLAKQMSGLDINVFDKVETKNVTTEDSETQMLSFQAEDKNYYIYNYVPTPINTTHYGTLDIEGLAVQEYSAGNNGIIAIEEHFVGDEIFVSYKPTEEYKDYVDLKIYSFNQENFEKVISRLKENQLEVTKREKNILEGIINVSNDDSLLMITVPFEKGWNIYVDGKKVDYEEIYDTFVGIRLDEGQHEIKMVFYSPGIVVGSMMSITGIGILIIMMYKDKKKFIK